MTGVSDPLRDAFRHRNGVAVPHGKWLPVADLHQALALLEDVPFGDRQCVQLCGDTGLNTGAGERYFRLFDVVQ